MKRARKDTRRLERERERGRGEGTAVAQEHEAQEPVSSSYSIGACLISVQNDLQESHRLVKATIPTTRRLSRCMAM